MGWRSRLAAAVWLSALACTAAAQSLPEPQGARPLEAALERPYVLRLWRANRAFVQINLAELDADNRVLAPNEASVSFFDTDVFVMFLPSFTELEQIEGHVLEPILARELPKARPTDSLRMMSVPLTRNEDGARKSMFLVAASIENLTELSDLCLAVMLYDVARWFYTSSAAERGPAATARSLQCMREGWTSAAQARAADVPSQLPDK